MNEYIEAGVINGENIISPTENKDSVAKKIITSQKGERYYVKFYRGRLVDPNSGQFKKDNHLQKWIPVSNEVFGLYLKYLRTGKVQFLASAERKI